IHDKINITMYNTISMVIFTVQTFAGLWINAFIISVVCIGLLKKKSFNSNEKILLFLGCSRFGYLCMSWLYFLILIIYPLFFGIQSILILSIATQTFLHFCNLWVSSCLSVFYCIKIANFRHSFFTFLKAKIDRIVPWLLLGSVLLSLSISIFVFKVNYELPCKNLNATTLDNIRKLRIQMDAYLFPFFFIYGIGFSTAFLAVIFSALLLLFSLWRHKGRMQANSVKNVSVEAHIKAMKSILSFFFLYSINFACLVLSLVYATDKHVAIKYVISVFLNVFPIVHSLVLIFSNPKLEKALLRTLLCVKYKVCRRK
ncbi:TA2R9 protein, partial [Centropus unirufus]|nr:TA2R9 protein [Centropus unirufus]